MQDMERTTPVVSRLDDDDIDLWALAQTLWKNWKLIVSVTAIGAVGSAIYAFSQPNIYTATTTIMPVDSSSDRLSSALSSLGALGGLASQAGVGLKASAADKFVALLNSRTMTENVITKHELLPVLFPERWDNQKSTWKSSTSMFSWGIQKSHAEPPTVSQAVRRLKGMVASKVDLKAGMVDVNVEHENPQSAADIANYYVIELGEYLKGNSFTTAQQNREFLEIQLRKVSDELASIEDELKSFQEKHKLVALDAQTQASVQTYASLKSQLMAKEMEINLQEKSTSESDVQLIALNQEVFQLKEKLASIEEGESGGLVSFKDAPGLGIRFAQLTRDLMVRQEVYKLVTQQHELSKIEEAKEALAFQVIDKAIPPDQKSKPKRFFSVVLATAASLMIGAVGAVFVDKVRGV